MSKVKSVLACVSGLAFIWGMIWGVFFKSGLLVAALGLGLGALLCKTEKTENDKGWWF